MKQRNPVPRNFVEEKFAEQFSIGKEQAYRVVRKIAKESEHLTIRKGGISFE